MLQLFKTFVSVIFIVGLCTCSLKKTNPFPENIKKLQGTWQLKNSEMFETWNWTDSLFTGKSYKIENGDSTLRENLRILKIDNDIFYEAKVTNQNKDLPVLFKLTFHDKNNLVFENPNHDFPKIIRYTFLEKNYFTASVSDGEKTIEFHYQKIIPE